MTRTEAAYIAGLLDGEGSISIFISKSPSRPNGAVLARVKIGMCDEPMMLWLKSVTGNGNIGSWRRKEKNWKRCYTIMWNGYGAVPMLRAIKPFLRLKNRQVELFLKWVKISKKAQKACLRDSPKTRQYPLAVWKQAEELIKQVRELNRRGTLPLV